MSTSETTVEERAASATPKLSVLVVDDDPAAVRSLAGLLERWGYRTTQSLSGTQALQQYRETPSDVVLVDMRLPDTDGIKLTEQLLAANPNVGVVVITGHASIGNAVAAMRAGARDYLLKPLEPELLHLTLQRLQRSSQMEGQLRDLTEEVQGPFVPSGFIGASPAMQRVYKAIRFAARSASTTVLITGETGTGKELVARAIHYASARKDHPFVEVNCAALTESLAESEFFGHVKGAFTDAVRSRPGKFLRAHQGSLFLDEVGCLTQAMQAKLLRVLQERRFHPVGSDEECVVDVRILSATNDPLDQLVEKNGFRQDLFYRLNVLRVELPPLRERLEDLPQLFDHFARRFSSRLERSAPTITSGVFERLLQHRWPGNVRELENVVEVALSAVEGDELGVEHLPDWMSQRGGNSVAVPAGQSLDTLCDAFERKLITAALDAHRGNMTKTAADLGVTVRSLRRRMERLELKRADFANGDGDEAAEDEEAED